MVIEIKRIFYTRTRKHQAHERRIREFLMQCLRLRGYSMPRYGVFSVDILDSTTKEDWEEPVLCMSERILEAVPTMVKGESKTFESPLKVKLTKNVNYTAFDHIGGTWFLDVKEIKDTEESYRGALLVEKPDWDSDEEYNFDLETDRWEENWQIPQEVSIQIKLSLEAADRKLENFAEGMYKALVLDFQFDQLFDDYLYIAKLQGRQKTCREIINISTVYTS